MSIEAARTAYEEAMTALQLASIDERTRNAERLQSLVDHEGQSYLLREMEERTQIQAAAEAKWRNASHAAQSELHKMESEAVLRVRALLQKLHHNNNENTYSDHFNDNSSSIDAGNNHYINGNKANAFANEGMVHSYMMYNETDNMEDDIYDSYSNNNDHHEVDQRDERRSTELLEPEQYNIQYRDNDNDVYIQQNYNVENEYDEYMENEEELPEGENELHELDHSVEMLENTDIDVTLIDVDEKDNVVDVEEEIEQKEMNTNSNNVNSDVPCEVAKDKTESEHVLENTERETQGTTENVYAVHNVNKQENGSDDNTTQENHHTHRSPVKSVVAHLPEIDLLPLPVMPISANDNTNKVNKLDIQTECRSSGTKIATMPKLYDNLLDNTQSQHTNIAANIVLQPECINKVANTERSNVIRNLHIANLATHHEWRTQQTTSLTNEEMQPTTSSLHHANRNYVNYKNEQTSEPRNTREQVIQSPSRLVTNRSKLHPHLSTSASSSVPSSSARLSSPSTVHANEEVLSRLTSSTTRHTNTTTSTTITAPTERASHANNVRSSSHLTTTTTRTTATTDTTTSLSSSSPSTTRYNSTYNSSLLSSSMEEMEITSTSSTLSSEPSLSSSCSITESSNTISTNDLNGAASLQTTANELLHKMQDILARRRQHLMSHRYH